MDLDLDNLPRTTQPSERVIDSCIQQSATYHDINPLIIKAIRKQEAGRVGLAMRNSNGSHDLGIMQINTINFERINKRFPQVSLHDLIYKPCVNIFVATWFLKERIAQAGGDVWRGVGNYHSATPKYHKRYLDGVINHYKTIRQTYIKGRSQRSRTVIGIHRNDS